MICICGGGGRCLGGWLGLFDLRSERLGGGGEYGGLWSWA